MTPIEMLKNGTENLFITGKAGTGKSTLLREFVSSSSREIVVCAPTGVAAINAKGQTIHSLFHVPPRLIDREEARKIGLSQSKVVRNINTLVIDEIGMLRADMLDNIDIILRMSKGKPREPFGGVRIIGFGDLFQLPPIVSASEEDHYYRSYSSPYFFSSTVASSYPFRIVELETVFRQSDNDFIEILNQMRHGNLSQQNLNRINDRVNCQIGDCITLCPYNQQVKEINDEALKRLPGKEFRYVAEIKGNFPKNSYPNDEIICLKNGIQVMLLRNERQENNKFLYVNGTIAKVVECGGDDSIRVALPGGKTHEIGYSEWESIKYDFFNGKLGHEVSGTFYQIPAKIAAAFTIHKSQGKTFDRVKIDMGRGAFDYGQTYVAFSRCRSLPGISLSKPLSKEDVVADTTIIEFFDDCYKKNLVIESSQPFDPGLSA